MVKKGELRDKLWSKIKYSASSTNCANCDYSNKTKWVDDAGCGKGECNVLDKLPFIIIRSGICKLHSRFR